MIYKLVTRVIQYFCFPNRPMKGGEILDFFKRGILEKGVDLEKGGYDPLTMFYERFSKQINQKERKK